MKATRYELRQRAIRADHCDTTTTVTGVTVVPERRKKPQKLISSGFEHCDRRKAINLSQWFRWQPPFLACFNLRRGCYES